MPLSQLAQLIPLNGLSSGQLEQAAHLYTVRTLKAGQTLFSKDAQDDHIYFLLEGEVVLDPEDGSHSLPTIRAGSSLARHQIAPARPRRFSCMALTACRLIRFPEEVLDNLVTRDQTTAYEVTELEGDDPQWTFQLLSSPAFINIPAAHLPALLGHLENLPVNAGQVVLRQGEVGDYYYLIRAGRAQVTRTTDAHVDPIVLAELGVGQGFGEEALISGDHRNATVTMLTDGQLKRLAGKDFDTLLKAPLVQYVSAGATRELLIKGATLIDVRMEAEYEHEHLPNSINIPLCLLRLKTAELIRTQTYIVYCQSGRRSSTAAFLLAQRGFDARVLEGGLDKLPAPASPQVNT